MISRRQTREYLLQSLYARFHLSPFDRDAFYQAYFLGEHSLSLDMKYLDTMESLILKHEKQLFTVLTQIAPRFDIETLPVIHILILIIALTEMLYWNLEPIPASVSINEAVEMAKRFSDEQGKNFINGALSTFLQNRETIDSTTEHSNLHFFAL